MIEMKNSTNDCIAPYRVLVVDDMATNRLIARSVLSRQGFEVDEASSGKETLVKLSEQSYDTVLLDIMMPDMDGFETCQKIRNELELPLLPVIMLTSLNDADDVARSMKVGASDFIHKPFNATELLARVNAAVAHKRLTDRLDDTESVLFALARMVEAKDSTTGDHCDRLAHRSVVFGKYLNCGYEELEALRRGGVLHDIGKLGIPDAILLKPGPLNDEEWDVMRRHPVIGAHLCSALKTMHRTSDIVSYHHERWDGSGYPKGLKGDDIPLLARIFQLVDVFDALTSARPYKKAFSTEKAIDIMQDECEKGFWDPQLLTQFITLLREYPKDLELPQTQIEDKSATIFESISALGTNARRDKK